MLYDPPSRNVRQEAFTLDTEDVEHAALMLMENVKYTEIHKVMRQRKACNGLRQFRTLIHEAEALVGNDLEWPRNHPASST